jgi:polyphenol oxidase
MFFSSKLNSFKNLKHCFFSKKGGVSKGYYESLNCGLGSGDKKEDVLKNLELVANKISCKKKYLITLNQTHSNKVIHFKNESDIKNKLIGDAIVCEIKNVGISILTADCAPILFYDSKKKIVGCAHAGWKGALGGIIKNTIKKFNDLNSNNKDLIAVVGPCIDKENYEVKENFLKKFLNVNRNNEKFFQKNGNKGYFFDLRAFINDEILNLNIKNIENIEMDTFSNHKYFYSYRRSTHNNEGDYGRCISVILMT